MVGAPGNQPPSLAGFPCYLINITKDTYIVLNTGNSKNFNNEVQIHIFCINHTIIKDLGKTSRMSGEILLDFSHPGLLNSVKRRKAEKVNLSQNGLMYY